MWDLSIDVQWWEECQLRILVLGSFFLKFVLFAGSMMRHARAIKSCMWLAYIGADAVAIYALSTLFNRHKVPAGGGGDDGSSSSLEVLWAPVLLLHLGGHHTFTAYSIEDNELWGRHLVTLMSQVTVALYVFCKAWPGSGGDKRLLQAAVLLFIVGILKFAQKPLALRAASFNSLVNYSAVYPRRRAQRVLYLLCMDCVPMDSTWDAESLRDEDDHDLSLEEYAQKEWDLALVTDVDHTYRIAGGLHGADKQFVDLSDPYSRRLRGLSSFLKLDLRGVMDELRNKLNTSFIVFYTNGKSVISCPGFLLKLSLPFISLSSAVLFGQSHKHAYEEKDVRVTYILLWSATLLGFLQFLVCTTRETTLNFQPPTSQPIT